MWRPAKPHPTRHALAIAALAALALIAPCRGLTAQQRSRSGDPVADYVRGLTSISRLSIVSYSANLRETVVSGVTVSSVNVAPGRVDVTVQNGVVYAIPTDSVWYVSFDTNSNTLALYLRR